MDFTTRKEALILQLQQLEDVGLLEKLEALLEVHKNEKNDWWDGLSDAQKESIKRGQAQADAGKLIPYEAVMMEVRGLIAQEDGTEN